MKAAFEKYPEALVKNLKTIFDEMKKARDTGDDRRYLQLDTAFHQALFDNSSNTFLNDAYQTIASKMAALRNRLGAHPDHMAKSFAEHGRMIELLEKVDITQAVDVLVAHIGRKEGSYWNR